VINFNDTGRIGKDAVVRNTANGDSVTGFSLAIDSGFGERKQTLWLDCALWGSRGEKLAEYLVKGAQVHVAGELGQREHDGKTYLTCRVSDLRLVGGKPEGAKPAAGGGGSARPARQAAKPAADEFDDGDSIPF